jgi:hypothetical protein
MGSCVSTWSPAGGPSLGGSGNFRRWGLVGESRSLGIPLKVTPGPQGLSHSLLPVCDEVNASTSMFSYCSDVQLRLRPKVMGPAYYEGNPLKLWAKENPSSISVVSLRNLSQYEKSNQHKWENQNLLSESAILTNLWKKEWINRWTDNFLHPLKNM